MSEEVQKRNRPDKYNFDRIYSSEAYKFRFGYDTEMLEDILKYKKEGKVLDLGCGQGGMSLALAKEGFDVTCVDISKAAIDKIKKEAESRGIKLKAIVADLEEWNFDEKFDIIIANGIVHFLGDDSERFIKKIQEHTFKEGLNAIDAFYNKWTSKETFEEFYEDWEILEKEEYKTKLLSGAKKDMIYMVAKK